jgi:two-component system, NtrC family, sensor histidine kinase HydH
MQRSAGTGSKNGRGSRRGGFLHSLRTKFVAFSILIVVTPGLLIAFLAFSSAREVIDQVVGVQLTEVAGDAADALVAALASPRSHLRSWANNEVMRELPAGDPDKRVTRYLASLQEGSAVYLELLCVDLDGRVTAATDPRDIGRSIRREPWFTRAAEGREAFAGPSHSARYGSGVLHITSEIFHPDDPAQKIGYIAAVYDWRKSGEVLARIRHKLAALGWHVDFLLLDERSVVIGGSWNPQLGDWVGMSLREAGWRSVDGSTDATADRSAVEEPTIDALVSFASLQEFRSGWRVMGVWRLRDALRPVRTMQRQWTIVLLGVLLASAGVAAALSDRIVRPLRALTAAIRELAHFREPRRPVEVQSRDEIGELADSFNAMVRELKEAQEELVTAAKFSFAGEIAAGIAHEVRTPLGVLRTSAQILDRRLPGEDSKSKELVGMMIDEVDRLERVVAGLLELTRPREPVIEPVPLEGLLSRAAAFLTDQAAARGVKIQIDPGSSTAIAWCDPEQMYQVVLNLVVNAVNVSPAGGTVTLRVVARRDDRVGIEVVDDGPGVAPEVRERIFTPFFTTREEGTGLGLTVAQRIVSAQRGTIEVENAPGRGACFRVDLAAAPGAEVER